MPLSHDLVCVPKRYTANALDAEANKSKRISDVRVYAMGARRGAPRKGYERVACERN